MRLIWVFLLLPIVEIALFVKIGGWIGVWGTLALVVLTAMAGVALIRHQGTQAALDFQQSMDRMRDPLHPMAQRTLLSIAGLLLIVPGFLTDALGVLLLLPQVRGWILRRFSAAGQNIRFSYGFPQGGAGSRGDDTIDGEYVIHDDPYLPEDGRNPMDRGADHKKSGWTRH